METQSSHGIALLNIGKKLKLSIIFLVVSLSSSVLSPLWEITGVMVCYIHKLFFLYTVRTQHLSLLSFVLLLPAELCSFKNTLKTLH